MVTNSCNLRCSYCYEIGKRVATVEDVVAVGDVVTVKFLGTDEKGRLNLSMRDANN
jgi:predicted RNA-binding protein with RPS1 domain